MDELGMLRAVRPQDVYPGERRAAARDRLLAQATSSARTGWAARPVRAPRPARAAWRTSLPWQAGLAATVAIGATLAVAGAHHAGSGTHPSAGGATEVSAAGVLLLAANAAAQSAPPAGARWVVWENQAVDTASAQEVCGSAARLVTANAYVKVAGLASCPAGPPASLPGLRHARPVSANAGYPDLGPLPDQPGPLLRAVERWYAAHYKNNADALPGHPVPALTQAGLDAAAFDILRTLLEGGVTSPSQAVQLRALALIPGTSVVTGARNAAGQPGIAVTITSPDPAQSGFSQDEIIFDPHSYQDIGGVLTQPDQYAKGGFVTLTTTRVWQAYYDAAGHRL